MKKKILFSLLTGLALGICMYVYLLIKGDTSIALYLALFCVIIGSVVAYFKVFRQIDFALEFQEIVESEVRFSESAGHYIERKLTPGMLYLTDGQVIFQTSSLGILNRHQVILGIDDIKDVQFHDGVMHKKGMNIIMENGTIEQFTTKQREEWKVKILNKA